MKSVENKKSFLSREICPGFTLADGSRNDGIRREHRNEGTIRRYRKIMKKEKYKMKKYSKMIILALALFLLTACEGAAPDRTEEAVQGESGLPDHGSDRGMKKKSGSEEETGGGEVNGFEKTDVTGSEEVVAAPTYSIMDDAGETLETRVRVPEGYEREEAQEGSLTAFLRSYPLLPAGSKVHLYDGSEKGFQNDHAAVFALPLEEYDLQQCADSIMRIYAEYFWATEQYDRIKFHFTSGFLAEYTKWREGYRVTVNGNDVSWVKSKEADPSYECFVKYLRTVFCYAGTLSMEKESEPAALENLKAGDVFLYGGSPGHVVMVADICTNGLGKKAFLLAQGYMPAQEFHLLKNEAHPEDPWYYEEEVTYPFHTPEYTFLEGSLRSLIY